MKADTVHRGGHSRQPEPPINATLPRQPINDPARATYRATSPPPPKQSHKQAERRSKHMRGQRRALSASTFSSRQPCTRTTAANSQKPPRAPDALKSIRSSACRPVRDAHNGTAPLPGSPSPPPSRRLPHLVLQAGRTAREGHCGRLRATGHAQARCKWLPCRPPCRLSSNDGCRCRLGVCHRCSGKAPACLVTQAHEQRSRAMLPLTTTPSIVAQHQPRRSFMTMRAYDEQMRLQTAVERTMRLMHCPCHARSNSHVVVPARQSTSSTILTSHPAQRRPDGASAQLRGR